ncbi:MAG: DNA polymerase III subunit delta [Verrucomicrobiota bacterium JB022]|nr:DNA polymerase III subunit delta [Verrucomicrobiota bacterium JB022]
MSQAILIAGPEDEFQVTLDAKRQWEQMTRDLDDDLAKEVVDGQVSVADEVEQAMARFTSAVRTLPMFSDRKAVWFRNITFLGDNRVGKTEAALKTAEQLAEFVERLDPSVSVLLSASPFDSRRKAQKALMKVCDATVHKKARDSQGVVDLLRQEAKREGLSFGGNAAEIIAEKTGGNGRMALSEFQKLATYVAGETTTISEALATEMVAEAGESSFYEPVLAFHSGRLPWAMEALRRYFFAGREGRALLVMLQKRNSQLIQLRALDDAGYLGGGRGVSLDRASSQFGHYFADSGGKVGLSVLNMAPWQAGQAAKDAHNFTLKQLLRFQQEFLEAFRQISGAAKGEQEGIFRTLFLRCLS